MYILSANSPPSSQIWDDCATKKCPFFVLTNNETWIFGLFVAGWTKCLVSDPVSRTDTGDKPSVLQCLIYWIASAMELGGENALTRHISPWVCSLPHLNIQINSYINIHPDGEIQQQRRNRSS
ncbi:hypothetical protein M422DRAFT_150399 [Sphaerobolus stellatus SS14]|nr:hypothetical protein M422DRAFT_150399 [Sphaerobolus stellatus SS14]